MYRIQELETFHLVSGLHRHRVHLDLKVYPVFVELVSILKYTVLLPYVLKTQIFATLLIY